jgi:hypothetical protein
MNNCRACGNEFEPLYKYDKFCSQKCAADFSGVMSKVNSQNQTLKRKQEAESIDDFSWQSILRRKGKFVITNKELEDIYDSTKERTKFEMLLASQNLIVKKGSELSVIKKVL